MTDSDIYRQYCIGFEFFGTWYDLNYIKSVNIGDKADIDTKNHWLIPILITKSYLKPCLQVPMFDSCLIRIQHSLWSVCPSQLKKGGINVGKQTYVKLLMMRLEPRPLEMRWCIPCYTNILPKTWSRWVCNKLCK